MIKFLVTQFVIAWLLLAPNAYGKIPEGLTGTLVVLNKQGDDASFIDLASGDLLATLPTGEGPHELVISDDGLWAVGTDYSGGDSLTVFDIQNLAVERTIDLTQYPNPHGILLMPDNKRVLVTSESSQNLVLVDFMNGEIVQSIGTEQSGSHMVALSEDGSTAFTSNGGSDSVSVIDLNKGKWVKTLDVPDSPEAITTNKAGNEIWVGSNDEGTVSVISAVDGSTVAQFDGFTWAYRVLLSEDEKYAVIPDYRQHQLHIFDAQSKTGLGVMEMPSAGPQGVAWYSDDRTLFLSLSSQNKILVVDIVSMQVLGEYPAGLSPDGIAYSRHVLSGKVSTDLLIH